MKKLIIAALLLSSFAASADTVLVGDFNTIGHVVAYGPTLLVNGERCRIDYPVINDVDNNGNAYTGFTATCRGHGWALKQEIATRATYMFKLDRNGNATGPTYNALKFEAQRVGQQ